MPPPKPTAGSSSKPTETASAVQLALTKLQTFSYREIARTDITNAPYNPRTISGYARKKLKKSLGDVGLVETLVWNQRTGHLVGGHQRLKLIDEMEGTDQYRIGVAAIDVDLQREIQINVLLNNQQAQGAFDQAAFFKMLGMDAAPSIDALGFTKADLEMEFGAVAELDALFGKHQTAAAAIMGEFGNLKADADAMTQEPASEDEDEEEGEDEPRARLSKAESDALNARREAYLASRADKPAEQLEYFLMVVFATTAAKERFLARIERPQDLRFMDALELKDYLREDLQDAIGDAPASLPKQ